MKNISEWIGILLSFASFLSSILSFYKFRVSPSKSFVLRRMEWEKSIIISLSLGFIVYSSIKFYNQVPPPNESAFRSIYYYLHGEELPWKKGIYSFDSANIEASGHLVKIEELEISERITRFRYHVAPLLNSSSEKYYDPLTYPILGFGLYHKHNLISRGHGASLDGSISGWLEFPTILNEVGNIYLWADGKKGDELTLENYTFSFSPPDNQGKGTTLWGMLFIISLGFFIIGITRNSIKSFKNKLIEEGEEIRAEKNEKLKKILNGRSYSQLSFEEKRKHNEISRYYDKTRDAIIEVLTGRIEKSIKKSEITPQRSQKDGANKDD